MSESNGQPNINWDTVDGAAWVANDEELARRYAGKLVVALPGRIVAVGDDVKTVRQEAAHILGIDQSTILVRAITHPDEWFKDYPVCSSLPAPQAAG